MHDIHAGLFIFRYTELETLSIEILIFSQVLHTSGYLPSLALEKFVTPIWRYIMNKLYVCKIGLTIIIIAAVYRLSYYRTENNKVKNDVRIKW